MTGVSELPTRKDEAWRYSAVERLTGAALDDWRSITVAAGETMRECFTIADGPETADTELRRLRVTVGEGARCELFAVIASAEFARVEVEVTWPKARILNWAASRWVADPRCANS